MIIVLLSIIVFCFAVIFAMFGINPLTKNMPKAKPPLQDPNFKVHPKM